MAGGMDLLIVGVADNDNLDDIATGDQLEAAFNAPSTGLNLDEIRRLQKSLIEDPSAVDARISYLQGETGPGVVTGAALGYLITDRFPYANPVQVAPILLQRITELSSQFQKDLERLGLEVGGREIGLWSVNVRDT